MNYNEFIKNNRLFILGAGFSAGAGIPMIGNILEKTMNLFKNEASGLFERVNNYAKICFQKDYIDYSAVDFSKLCTYLEYIELSEYGGGERFSDSGSREKIAFKFYLSKAIALSTPSCDNVPQLYFDFINQLNKYDMIITFNWDLLLEIVIESLGKTYSYSNFERRDVDFYIFKLHGSINWKVEEDLGRRMRLQWNPLGFKNGIMNREIYYSKDLLSKYVWQEYESFSEIRPFIVLPGYGKGFDIRSLAPLWYKIESAFATTHDIFIIGFSLADDDFLIDSFFLDNLPYVTETAHQDRKIFVINPDTSIKNRYRKYCDTKITNYLFECFNTDHINLMLERKATTHNTPVT